MFNNKQGSCMQCTQWQSRWKGLMVWWMKRTIKLSTMSGSLQSTVHSLRTIAVQCSLWFTWTPYIQCASNGILQVLKLLRSSSLLGMILNTKPKAYTASTILFLHFRITCCVFYTVESLIHFNKPARELSHHLLLFHSGSYNDMFRILNQARPRSCSSLCEG